MILLVLPVTLALITGLLFVIILGKIFLVKHEPAGLPQGKMGLPLVGKTFSFYKPHQSSSIGDFLQEYCSRYGKVFKSRLFGSPTIVACDIELCKFILQNEGKLFQTSYPKPFRDILGKNSLLFVTGEVHKKFRGIEVGVINKFKRQPDFLRVLDKLCRSFVESLRGHQLLPFAVASKKFSFNLMVTIFLEMEQGEPLALQLVEDFSTFIKGFVSFPINLPWTLYGKALKARTRTLAILKQVIKGREMRKKDGVSQEDLLIETLWEEELSDAEKVNIMLDILWAGYETTSGLFSLLVYFLGQSPRALQTLKDEHRALRKKKKEGEPLDWEDFKQMEFSIMVINEALRCGNLVKFLQREAINDVDFKGYHIPAGWKVYPIFSAVHLDPSLHENPSEFNPWRWTDPATSKKVMPFGGGVRQCPGSELAKLEAAFLLHHLVINYTWTTKEDDHPMLSPLLDFKRGLLLTLEVEK